MPLQPFFDSGTVATEPRAYPPGTSRQAALRAGARRHSPLPSTATIALANRTAQDARCRIVSQITTEMVMLVGERAQMRQDRRRSICHIRQISMYICHVVLQISLTEIGLAFSRDRTTAGHACHVVEDRRDNPAYDDFLAAIERVVMSVFGEGTGGLSQHRAPDDRAPDDRGTGDSGPEDRRPEDRGPEDRGPEDRGLEQNP